MGEPHPQNPDPLHLLMNPRNRPRPSKILGPNGKPAAYFLYPTPRFNLRQYKPRYWLSADTKANFGEYDRWEAVNYSRQLFAQIPELSTSVRDKNTWSFGSAWDPHYMGVNRKWGDEAEDWLKNQFYPMCNVRGPLYDLRRTLMISGLMWDVDGDDALVFTESQSGFPQIAMYPGTKVGTQANGARGNLDTERGAGVSGTVKGGPFDGAKIFDGVIQDRNNRMIGIRFVGEDGEITDIPSYSCDMAYEPEWHDQGRGIPRVVTSLLRWMNLQDIDEFLQKGMKRAASVGLKFKNDTGEGGLGNEVVVGEDDVAATLSSGQTMLSGGSSPKIAVEEVEGGEMYYLNSLTGEDIEALDYQNPHPNSEEFVKRIMRGSMASVGWLYELLNLSETGRAPTRLACDIGNQSIGSRQESGYRRWKRVITYAIAKAMKNGLISKNYDGMDPYLWEPGYPKPLSVDAGNDEQADRENLKLGTTSKTLIAQKHGWHRNVIRRHRTTETVDLIEDALAISQKYPQVPFEKVMELLEQRGANPVAQAPAAHAEPDADDETDGDPKK